MKKIEKGKYGLIGHTGFIGTTLKKQYQFVPSLIMATYFNFKIKQILQIKNLK